MLALYLTMIGCCLGFGLALGIILCVWFICVLILLVAGIVKGIKTIGKLFQ